MTAQVIRFPGFNRELIRRYLEARAQSTDPADYPGQDVFGPVNFDGRKRGEDECPTES